MSEDYRCDAVDDFSICINPMNLAVQSGVSNGNSNFSHCYSGQEHLLFPHFISPNECVYPLTKKVDTLISVYNY